MTDGCVCWTITVVLTLNAVAVAIADAGRAMTIKPALNAALGRNITKPRTAISIKVTAYAFESIRADWLGCWTERVLSLLGTIAASPIGGEVADRTRGAVRIKLAAVTGETVITVRLSAATALRNPLACDSAFPAPSRAT